MFLPVIEDHPLMIEIGDRVIECALLQMQDWHDQGIDLPVSVNVSALQLQQPDFVERLGARLAAHPRIQPSHLELEVLETSALQNVLQSSHVLAACRKLGVQISVDDFGAGYSSLTYLKRLPANLLKIDQSFVRDMLDTPESLTIIEGVLGLAAAFHRAVIAEGVESAEHGLMLLQMGCDLAQGFGIARPMPAGEIKAWMAAWRPDPRWAQVPEVQAGNRTVLYAMTEHRAWLGDFEAFLEDRKPLPPTLDARHCSVGAWLLALHRASDHAVDALQTVEDLHRQFHAAAEDIFTLHAGGRQQDALSQLVLLRQIHGRFLESLHPFTHGAASKGGYGALPPIPSLDQDPAAMA